MTETLLGVLKNEAVRLGEEFLRDGLDLAIRNLRGEASDSEILEWVRANQGREPE